MMLNRLAEAAEALLTRFPPALICQACFIFAAVSVLTVAALPPSMRQLLTQYGARRSTTKPIDDETGDGNTSRDILADFFTTITAYGQVPHSWFMHFYVVSVCGSVFWAWQLASSGHVLKYIATAQARSQAASESMSMQQVVIAWSLVSMQGTRRLYEYLAITNPSTSQMWIVHWLLGSAYYVGLGVALWVEGSGKLCGSFLPRTRPYTHSSDRSKESILQYMATKSIKFEALSLVELASTLLFLLMWSMQYRCHKYLASLKKYSLPDEGLFRFLICPHYTCECVLYLSLAVLAAPRGRLCNQTVLCAWVFVTINLGVTASGTQKWYVERFGTELVHERWAMIPLLY
jgi:3-oxo-5-alpha-steroid 4-dehydrogenase 3 / polyprenol reductase